MSRRGAQAPAALLTLLLSGCAAAPAAAPVTVSGTAAVPVAAAAVAGPPAASDRLAQQAAATAALDARLKSRLGTLPLSDAVRQIGGDGQPPRLLLDADRAFEAGSAQLKPALLLPLAEAASASRDGGAWVLHAVARAPSPADTDLAERRAASVAAYLGTQGIAGGRLRAETRSGRAREIEVHFVPIIPGHEARAWMPPAGLAGPGR